YEEWPQRGGRNAISVHFVHSLDGLNAGACCPSANVISARSAADGPGGGWVGSAPCMPECPNIKKGQGFLPALRRAKRAAVRRRNTLCSTQFRCSAAPKS